MAGSVLGKSSQGLAASVRGPSFLVKKVSSERQDTHLGTTSKGPGSRVRRALTDVPSHSQRVADHRSVTRGGNGLLGERHLGCGRSKRHLRGCPPAGGPARPTLLSAGWSPARQSSPRDAGFGSRILGKGPAWVAPSGVTLSFRWVVRPPFFQARAHIGARQRVSEIRTGWGQSVGALTDVFAVVARQIFDAEATPELCGSG